MIPRYTRPAMAAIWTPENRFRIWFEIEALAAEAMAELGEIPAAAARNIREKGGARVATINAADVARIDEIELETRHDVLAFLTWLAEAIGPDSRFVHLGMASSDVLDTCLSVQLTQATDFLLADLDAVLSALKARAFEHKHTQTIGRTHGIHAEPTSFGLKLAGHYAEFARGRARLVAARAEIAVAAISGAVGTFAHVDPRVEEFAARRLGLAVEAVSTQVIPRDRHAAYFCTLAVIACAVERLATEVRHLQRSEVREAEEFFHPGQKGSSSMPHKRNPVLSENLTGLARLVRSAVMPALENVALWHERDISHSSVERAIAPDTTVTLDFALARLAGMMERLTVYPARMAANLESLGGVVHSGGGDELVLAKAGISARGIDAYRIVQRNARWRPGPGWAVAGQVFRARLAADPEVAGRVDAATLDAAMDPQAHLANSGCDVHPRIRGTGAARLMCPIWMRNGGGAGAAGARSAPELCWRGQPGRDGGPAVGSAGGALAGAARRGGGAGPAGRRHLDGAEQRRGGGGGAEPAGQPGAGAGQAQPRDVRAAAADQLRHGNRGSRRRLTLGHLSQGGEYRSSMMVRRMY